MAFTCAVGFTGCTAPEAAGDEWAFGKDWIACEDQLDALVKLDAGTIEWQSIDWNSKEALLEAGNIDLIWNGMTITPGRLEEMCISIPYLYNKQAAVILKTDAEKYRSFMDIKTAIIGFEAGSAGEDVVKKAK